MKKLVDKFLFIVLFVVFVFLNIVSVYSNSNNDVTRIVSIAYDDSGSMNNNGQDFAYASYGLQNIIGVMNENDKLNVVKMSNVYKSNNFHIDNYELRKSEIEDVRDYKPIAENSSFQTVKTAVNYLVEQKIKNRNNPNVEYYLVVLTDGKFDNYDNQISKYISEMKDKFKDVYYRGIYIGIGNNVSDDLRKDVLNAPNNYYLTTKNNEGIVNALYEAHDIIYNRQLINDLSFDEKNATVSFEVIDNVKKIIIFEQDQQVPVVDIYSDDIKVNKKLIFSGTKSIEPILNSYIVHASNTYSNLPKGKINIEFLDKVDMTKNKLRVMVEYENGNGMSGLGGSGIGNNNGNGQGGENKGGEGGQRNNNGNNQDGEIGNNVSVNGQDKNNGNVSDSLEDSNSLNNNTDSFDDGNKVIIEKSKNIEEDIIVDDDKKTIVENNIESITEDNIESINSAETTIHNDLVNTEYIDVGPTSCGCALNRCGFGNVGIGSCALDSCDIGDRGCALNGCNRENINFPWNKNIPNKPISPNIPHNPNTPINWVFGGILPFLLSFLPIFLMLALLYGYFTKPRFDTKYHDIVVKRGRQFIDEGSMIKTNFISKLPPFYAQRGYGDNLYLKAHKDKDKVIIPKKYLTEDMRIDGDDINLNRDFTWYEDSELTKTVNGEKLTYIYRSRPYTERNSK